MDETEGLYSRCTICNRRITDKDVEKGNLPTRITSIPGFVHSRCKANFDIGVVSSPVSVKNLSNELKDLIGD